VRRVIATMLTALAFGQTAAAAGPELSWEPWTGRVPRNAIEGGVDFNGTTPLYICRSRHVNGVHPGKLLNGQCHIGWGGKEVVLPRFEVLVWRDTGYRSGYDYRRW